MKGIKWFPETNNGEDFVYKFAEDCDGSAGNQHCQLLYRVLVLAPIYGSTFDRLYVLCGIVISLICYQVGQCDAAKDNPKAYGNKEPLIVRVHE